ncbi:DUF2461 domain-containing protein [Nocardioides agariphilus]|uniref:DUF2461 domain-containing protein n=1 Tax=Nocardioides agariphilus TaxID=433664 RepID=A0A930YI77_9ACTN|nr:DUF2461 domain-containing protein [Nocardioides agariphilus]
MSDFAGFPVAALDFYDDLEVDNTKSYWEKHKATYDSDVKAPITALVAALAKDFAHDGKSYKVFRPYRDVRFAKDKTPYKTNQGAYIDVAPSTGWYVEISARGVRVGGGCYDMSSERIAVFRDAVVDDRRGAQLGRITNKLTKAGWELGGETLKTTPRGYDADHKRIDLLRHKSLYAGKSYGFEKVIHTPELLDRVRADWTSLRPLIAWLGTTSSE